MAATSELYRHSCQEAIARGELGVWRDSHLANIACRNAIMSVIRDEFDGLHLSDDCAKKVVDQFGLERVAYVLANTLQVKDWDGRFSHTNREWFGRITVPPDAMHNPEFAVDSHSAVLDGFMQKFRTLCQQMEYGSVQLEFQTNPTSPTQRLSQEQIM